MATHIDPTAYWCDVHLDRQPVLELPSGFGEAHYCVECAVAADRLTMEEALALAARGMMRQG